MVDGLIGAAFKYVWSGWHLFPLHELDGSRCSCRKSDCSSPGKHPRTAHGLADATNDPEMVEDWWVKWPTANIGVACGPSSLVVVDVDCHKTDAVRSLRLLLDGGFRLPPTINQITGSGGAHYFYRAPTWDLGNSAGRLPGVTDRLPGIDLRGRGGYVVVPPSKTVGDYEWIRSRVNVPAPCPNWLRPPPPPRRDRAHLIAGDSRGGGHSRIEALVNVVRRAREGQRNATLNWAAFRAREIDLPQTELVDILTAAGVAAGLTTKEVTATVASGLGLNGRTQ